MAKKSGLLTSKENLTIQLFLFGVSLFLFVLSTWFYLSGSANATNKAQMNAIDSTAFVESEEEILKAKLADIGRIGPAPYTLYSYKDFRDAIMSVRDDACEDKKQYGGAKWKSRTIYSGNEEVEVTTGNYTLCLDYGVRPNMIDCLVYSFGLNSEMTFEHAMEGYGCEVVGFDPTLSEERLNVKEKFVGFQVGIIDGSPQVHQPQWNLMRMKQIFQGLNQTKPIIDVLKVNTEFRDVQILTDIVSSGVLDFVRQFLVVFNKNDETTIEQFYSQIWVLERLGFVKFAAAEWAHPNCARTDPKTGEIEVHCYIVSLYNSKFYKKYFN